MISNARAAKLMLSALLPLITIQHLPIMAAEVLSAQIKFSPTSPFVNQPFDLQIEVRVTPGTELQDTQIDGLPDNTAVVFENLVSQERRQIRENGQTIDILGFISRGRGIQPVSLPLQCGLRTTLVERRTAAFFSQWISMPRALRITPTTLIIQPLPTNGRPDDFSGAVGQFTLTGTATPAQVQPGDIVTLCWELSGRGWLGDAPIRMPDPGGAFKTYPPQETARDSARIHLAMRQVVIPLTTNATLSGTARFSYFDPESKNYRIVTAGPFPLTFSNSIDKPAVRERRIEITAPVLPLPTLPDDAFRAHVQNIRRGWPLAITIMLAVLAVGTLAKRHHWLAFAAAMIILGIGIGWQRQITHRQLAATWITTSNIIARLCPADNALALFDLVDGHAVTPLETAGTWVRINADGREGWVPSTSLAKAKNMASK